MKRPYANVIVWSMDDTSYTVATMFVLDRNGTITQFPCHLQGDIKEVEEWQYLEYVAFSLFAGLRVTFTVCDENYRNVCEASFQRTYS